MFGRIKNKFKKIQALDQGKMLDEILAIDSVKAQIIDLNQHQLYDLGIQADGSETGQYSINTIRRKLAYGDARNTPGRIDHITGLDTGITYNSMMVKALPDGIVIHADDRNNFFDREPKGLGLTRESIAEIRPEIKQRLIIKVRESLAA